MYTADESSLHYKKVISIQIMTEVSMLLYSERRNVQCFTLSLPQHVYVLSAVLFPRSRPATLTNGYAFPANEPEPLKLLVTWRRVPFKTTFTTI